MKYNSLLTTIVAFFLCLAISCSSARKDAHGCPIEQVEALLSTGRLAEARSLANEIASDTTARLSATSLCRLSIIYMKLSDIEEADINTALATRCYRRAFILDADSAAAYYESLPLDESRHVDLMSKLEPVFSPGSHIYLEEDSIPFDDYEQP